MEFYYKSVFNYNIISKKNYHSALSIDKLIILEDNKYIISTYNLLLSLLSIKLLTKKKSYIRKSKKSNLFLGLRKNENIGLKKTLRKKSLSIFIKRLLLIYNKKLSLSRILNLKLFHKDVKLTLKNINKIDPLLLKEYKVLKPLTFSLVLSSRTKFPINHDNLNLFLLLSHLGLKSNKYEK